MVMPYESAWERLVAEKVDIRRDLVVLTKADIEVGNGQRTSFNGENGFFSRCSRSTTTTRIFHFTN